MINFTIESELSLPLQELTKSILCMDGVNFELMPLIRMSASKKWRATPISEWPVDQHIFKSWVTIFGIIPVDVHYFKMISVGDSGFHESSTSVVNQMWQHKRRLAPTPSGTKIIDVVAYQSRLPMVGYFMKPFYTLVFKRRHCRLKSKYASTR